MANSPPTAVTTTTTGKSLNLGSNHDCPWLGVEDVDAVDKPLAGVGLATAFGSIDELEVADSEEGSEGVEVNSIAAGEVREEV